MNNEIASSASLERARQRQAEMRAAIDAKCFDCEGGDADPHQGAFRALVDDMIALRERRRRVTRKVKVPTNTRDRPAEKEAERVSRADHMKTIRPTPAPLKKSLESLARDAARMAAQVRRQTEEIQRRTAIQMLDDLSAQAKAGQLGAIEAAKVDALRHANATALGLTATGVRR